MTVILNNDANVIPIRMGPTGFTRVHSIFAESLSGAWPSVLKDLLRNLLGPNTVRKEKVTQRRSQSKSVSRPQSSQQRAFHTHSWEVRQSRRCSDMQATHTGVALSWNVWSSGGFRIIACCYICTSPWDQSESNRAPERIECPGNAWGRHKRLHR